MFRPHEIAVSNLEDRAEAEVVIQRMVKLVNRTWEERERILPWLLLLRLRKPSHGYELMERLVEHEEVPSADPGLLYRTLRQLEEDGLVRSAWDTEGAGPARHLYEVTPDGVEYLHAWAVRVRETRGRLERFLSDYEAYFSRGS